MTKRSDVLGVILAGGKSTRMGVDKALLPLRGLPLIQCVAMALSEVLKDVVVVGDESRRFEFLHLPVIPDLVKQCGPLGGICTALSHSGGRSVFILSCDTPFVTPRLIEYIVDFRAPTPTKISSVHDELQPLCGLYGQDSLPAIETDIKKGLYKVLETLKGIKYTAIPITTRLPFYSPDLLKNMNTPEDYDFVAGGGC